MGSQQLLLLVLGIIIVGIAVGAGIIMFNSGSVDSDRNGLVADAQMLGVKAAQFWKTPTSMGGGDKSWTGVAEAGIAWTKAAYKLPSGGTLSEAAAVTAADTSLTFILEGSELGTDATNPTSVSMKVQPSRSNPFTLTVLN